MITISTLITAEDIAGKPSRLQHHFFFPVPCHRSVQGGFVGGLSTLHGPVWEKEAFVWQVIGMLNLQQVALCTIGTQQGHRGPPPSSPPGDFPNRMRFASL